MNLFDDLKLIYLRAIPAWHDYHRNTDNYLLLTPEVAIHRKDYEGLKPWQKEQRRIVAAGRSSTRAVISGRSAARLHGIETLNGDASVELTYPGNTRSRPRSEWPQGIVYRSRYLPPEEITIVHGLRVTTVARSLRDIAVFHGVLPALVAMESALRKHVVTEEELIREVTGTARYPGKKKVREAVGLASLSPDSAAESVARWVLLSYDIPGLMNIQMQVRIVTSEGMKIVDFLLNDDVILEIDGEIKYENGAYGRLLNETLREERRREVALQNKGFRVIRAGWKDLFPRGKYPPALVTLVASALQRAS